MNSKNSIVTYALVGLAAGTAVWLLMGTKGGRKQLDRASEGIRELTNAIRKSTKKEMDRASKLADRASEEIHDMRAEAKRKGHRAIQQTDQLAKEGISAANAAVKSAKQKTEDGI
ncbi:hypothetical protein ACFOET_14420 [Parapedobacter deserti]|uniref:YtxH domain-containing protein n=1 Tax=Parapedobacter deserti TaxID=1912957 RepID=A0ABV7JL49_9SPHI